MALAKDFTDTTTGLQHVIDRLLNWKFFSAQVRVKQHRLKLPRETRDVIDALASMFGNQGWMDECAMATVLDVAVEKVVSDLRQIEAEQRGLAFR